jgi:hypothetical protein
MGAFRFSFYLKILANYFLRRTIGATNSSEASKLNKPSEPEA